MTHLVIIGICIGFFFGMWFGFALAKRRKAHLDIQSELAYFSSKHREHGFTMLDVARYFYELGSGYWV